MAGMTLVEFLTAQVGKDEQVARAAVVPPWTAFIGSVMSGTPPNDDEFCEVYGDELKPDEATAEHVARHDPARVLRDAEAKRRIMARHSPGKPGVYAWITGDWCAGCGVQGYDDSPVTEDIDECPELRDLASVYADEQGYQERWRP